MSAAPSFPLGPRPQPRLRSVATLAPEELHARLAAFGAARLTPRTEVTPWDEGLEEELALRALESAYLESERQAVHARAAAAPRDGEAFVRWFQDLLTTGPGQGDPLFPWLAAHASYEQMRWFITQEVAGEAGFDDLVALTQVKMPARAKLEMARNYWDEMGQGHLGGMHGPMLERLAVELDVDRAAPVVWESLALGNVMVGLACSPRWAYAAVGALGVIELTAPGRARHVNEGLRRLGVGGDARRYFALHATLDVKHSRAWNAEVLAPLVDAVPEAAPRLAEGALMRLRAGERCFERYRRELGLR